MHRSENKTIVQLIHLNLSFHLMEIGEPLEDPSTPRSNGEILQKTAKVSFPSICCAIFLTHSFPSFFPKHFPDKNNHSNTGFVPAQHAAPAGP